MTTDTAAKPSLLDQLAKPKGAIADKMPTIADTELADSVRDLTAAMVALKDATGRKDMLAAMLAPKAEAHRIKVCLQSGKLASSIKLNGLTYTTQNRYASISPDEAPRLSSAFGAQFGLYFTRQYNLEIDATRIPEELLTQLAQLGAKITSNLKPSELYHTARTLNPDVCAKAPDIKPTAFFKL